MGHQPLGIASPAAALREAGHLVTTLDLSVEQPEANRFSEVDLVAISMPMHTAARLGIAVAEHVRRLQPSVQIACYGLYATLLHDRLTHDGLVDAIIGGEYEPALVALANRLAAPDQPSRELIGVGSTPAFPRQQFPLPSRAGLTSLIAYAKLQLGDQQRLVGYVEASRGCAHHCTHCPITPVYGGRLRLVQPDTVLADVDQLVEAGAEHITFGDPDFLNAVPHSLAIVEAMHARHPDLTFDSTIKVEHLLEHTEVLPRLVANGGIFITSAFESTNDEILRRLDKGHVAADLDRALAAANAAGIVLRPTWVAHTPWTTPDDFLDLLAFIEERGLVEHVQPVQYAIRLLLPPGAPLVPQLEAEGRIQGFNEAALSHTWASTDQRLDALQREIAEIVESGSCEECGVEHALETFEKVKNAAYRQLRGETNPVEVAAQPRRTVPGLTESWFC
jgi:radical SAM superfamily enzyme YgiQ (UPF0313 family)